MWYMKDLALVSFGGRKGPQAQETGQLLEAGKSKKNGSYPEPNRRNAAPPHLDFSPLWAMSDFWSTELKIINVC